MKKYLLLLSLLASPLIAMNNPMKNFSDSFSEILDQSIEPSVEIYAKHWKDWQNAVENHCNNPEEYEILFEEMTNNMLPLAIEVARKIALQSALSFIPSDDQNTPDMILKSINEELDRPEYKDQLKAMTKKNIQNQVTVLSLARKKYLETQENKS